VVRKIKNQIHIIV